MTGMPNPKVERAIIRGDALHLPLRNESVDLCITSPPYFALRAYGTGHEMEVGSEPTPTAYLEALWAATQEMARVLKPTGSIWVNLGDKYSGNTKGTPWTDRTLPWNGQTDDGRVADYSYGARNAGKERPRYETTIREKSLMGLPWRYAIGCIDQLGLILRAELIWSKPNGLPESVTDRVRRSHEVWFHLTKSPRYYAALDEIREPYAPGSLEKYAAGGLVQSIADASHPSKQNRHWQDYGQAEAWRGNPLGKLPGSVWTVPSEPLRLPPWIDTDHYAAFPTEWPRRLILAFSPPGICTVCGQGRFPVVERQLERQDRPGLVTALTNGHGQDGREGGRHTSQATILGYACGCTPHTDRPGFGEPSPRGTQSWSGGAQAHKPRSDTNGGFTSAARVGPWREYHLDRFIPPPTRPAVVLDPFGGTGTVPHVAHALGRIGIGVDLSEAYCKLAADETLARQRAAKVLGRVNQERQGTLL
jgi:DNA modification methylase